MLKKILDNPKTPLLLLRAALATVFLYAAISSFMNPEDWIGYLPGLLTDHVSPELLLKFFSLYELLLAVWLLSGVHVRYAALLSAATLGGIIMSNLGVFIVTFRDIGLLLAALALAALGKPKPTR